MFRSDLSNDDYHRHAGQKDLDPIKSLEYNSPRYMTENNVVLGPWALDISHAVRRLKIQHVTIRAS